MCLLSVLGMYLMEKGYGSNRLISIITSFGRNPLFFYLVHLWLYRFRAPKTMPPLYLTLPQTLVAWGTGLVVLYFLTNKYAGLKAAYPDSLLRYI